jgi:multidrug efflux pump
MCALLLRAKPKGLVGVQRRPGFFERMQSGYARSLKVALAHPNIVLASLVFIVALNAALIYVMPKSFFPEQDTGRITANLVADQSVSFQLMSQKITQMMDIVQHDPAVQDVVGFSGSGSGGSAAQTNTARVFISLKPLSQRDGVDKVMARLRRRLAVVPGARLFMQPVQDIRIGGRQSNAEYQYSLLGDSGDEVYKWAPKLLAALERNPIFTDLNSDQQQRGLETELDFDRDTASRLGLTMYQIDNTLYDAFGQRSVSTIYSAVNQYHVVMEVSPAFWQRPQSLSQIFVSTSGAPASGSETTALSAVSAGEPTALPTPTVAAIRPTAATLSSAVASAANTSFKPISNVVSLAVPSTALSSSPSSSSTSTASSAAQAVSTASQASLAATGATVSSSASAVSTTAESMTPLRGFASSAPGLTPLAVNHQSQFVATTLSFNLAPGKSLSDATEAIAQAARDIGLPVDVSGAFAGTALVYEQSLANEGFLILTAVLAVYIVLGVLYESFIHPITILSTLPSAGVGAVVTLMAFGIPLTIIALIGIILLIGIVKKNAIMMIDFALEAERGQGLNSRDAIFEAAILRFRPIMMTTTAAILGALPLCFSFGEGGELREPLGVAIVGGLIVSQALTLYTTPVVYIFLDRFAGRKPVRL